MFFDPILEPFFTKMVVGENVRSKYVIVILIVLKFNKTKLKLKTYVCTLWQRVPTEETLK